MKNTILVFVTLMITIVGYSQKLVHSPLPIIAANKNIGIISNMNTSTLAIMQKGSIGIATNQSKLFYSFKKNTRKIIFEVPNASQLVTTGLNTKIRSKNKVEWKIADEVENQYKLYIATATDSAKNFIVYSGYIYFTTQNKWKLIASFKINGTTESINNAHTFKSATVTANVEQLFTDTWIQGDNGSWNKLQNNGVQKPIVVPMFDIDSANSAIKDSLAIQVLINAGQTDAKEYKNGLYFTLMKKSTNPTVVKVTDTVSIYYKGYILGTELIFDQTSKESRTFPLGRLIKGWQIGLEGTHVGDKVKLIIPSGLAYGIRTRSPMILPNSVLVFEIETVYAKPVIK